MSGFTKGPWKVASTDTTFEVESVGGIRVVKTSWHDRIFTVYPCKAESLANVTLIAAAPEMLEALKAVVRVADRQTVEFDLARAAIAKATALSSAAPMEGERS